MLFLPHQNLGKDLIIETKMLRRFTVFRTWLDERLLLLLTFVKKRAV